MILPFQQATNGSGHLSTLWSRKSGYATNPSETYRKTIIMSNKLSAYTGPPIFKKSKCCECAKPHTKICRKKHRRRTVPKKANQRRIYPIGTTAPCRAQTKTSNCSVLSTGPAGKLNRYEYISLWNAFFLAVPVHLWPAS